MQGFAGREIDFHDQKTAVINDFEVLINTIFHWEPDHLHQLHV